MVFRERILINSMFSVAPNIVFAPNMTQNTEHKHRMQDTNTANFRSCFVCNFYNRAAICKTVRTRGRNPMFRLKLHSNPISTFATTYVSIQIACRNIGLLPLFLSSCRKEPKEHEQEQREILGTSRHKGMKRCKGHQ